MNAAAQDILNQIELLDPKTRYELTVGLLRRATGKGELPDEAFVELAAETFKTYDVEEAESDKR